MATITSSAGPLDVNTIVSQLMDVEKIPITKLQRTEASYQAKLSAWGTLKSALASYESAMTDLGGTSSFKKFKLANADDTVFTATAGESAAAGVYAIRPTALAAAHTLTSGTFGSDTATVGSGTLTFQFGTISGASFSQNAGRATKTVAIGAGQNTLAGIRDAVNAAGIGVAASIIFDGTDHRLVFTSKTGAANAMRITATDDDGNDTDAAGLSQLAYDPAAAVGSGRNLTEAQAAANATAVVNGIAVSSDSDTFDKSIAGIAFTAKKISASAVNLTVTQDSSAAQSSVDKFVKAYNDFKKAVTDLTKYAAGDSGPLQGDARAQMLLNQVRTTITQSVSGAATGFQRLSDIGVAMTDKGELKTDSAKLAAKIAADPTKVFQLFGRIAQASHSAVSFVSADNTAKGGTYAVNVTQAATMGRLDGSAAPGLTIDGSNNTLDIGIDGKSATLTLASQTYASAADMASDLQSRINGLAIFSNNGVSVAVTVQGGMLRIESQSYGSTSKVSVSGNGATNALGGAPTATDGVDVAGTLGGYPATGSGQNLSGSLGPVNGLKVRIASAATGDFGSVSFVDGLAKRLESWATAAQGLKGAVQASTDGLNALIKTNQKKQTALGDKLALTEQRYRAQFSKLDGTLASMSQTSTYLTQQLANLRAQLAGQ